MTPHKFVLDSGVAIAWFFPETDEERAYAAAVLRLIMEGATAYVPQHFHVEVAEFLLRRRRTKSARFSEARLQQVIDHLQALGIRMVATPDDYRVIIDSARRFHVQAKDAPFVKLAHDTGLALAVIDNGQRTAARIHGIDLVAFH